MHRLIASPWPELVLAACHDDWRSYACQESQAALSGGQPGQPGYANTKAAGCVSSTALAPPRCRDMLHQALSHADLARLPLLVLSNKMDLPEALQPAEVAAALELTALRDRAIHIAGCSALQNTGVQVRAL